MSSNIQLTGELDSAIPTPVVAGKVRLFLDSTDSTLKFKDSLGAIYIVGQPRDYKNAVRAVSSAALPAYTRLANVITASASGALPAQDSVTLFVGDSLLYTEGSGPTAPDNGIWEVTQVGNGGSPFILTRREDFSVSAQVGAGMLIPTGPEGPLYGSKLFILASANPIVLNTTSLVFADISGGGGGPSTPNYSLLEVSDDQTVPSGQVLISGDNLTIDNTGDLSIEAGADIYPAPTVDNYSIHLVPIRSTRIVQTTDQLLYTNSLQVDGDLIIDGDALDASPDTGDSILAKLTAIAPGTPAILGAGSHVEFKTPAQARAILDVYSEAQVDALVGASLVGTTDGVSVALGIGTLPILSTGIANVAIGNSALPLTSTGDRNIAIGTNAGPGVTQVSPSDSISIGDNASASASGIAIGSSAGGDHTNSIAIGYQALQGNYHLTNTVVGFQAGSSTCQQTTAFGEATAKGRTGHFNTALGGLALSGQGGGSLSGERNTAVGTAAAWNISEGSENIAIGSLALSALETGDFNVAVGTYALSSCTVDGNVAVGHRALDANTVGTGNVAIGFSALGASVTEVDNTAIGYNAALVSTSGSITAVGARALDANISGVQNTAVGIDALGANINSGGNTAVGYNALLISTGAGNTAVGARALDANTSGQANTAVGIDALGSASTVFNNTAVGFNAGLLATGGDNTLIGHLAGNTITTGTGNIMLGLATQPSSAGASDEINIGGAITGQTSTGNGQISFKRTVTNSITAAGTTLGAATQLTTDINRITVVAGGADSVKLPDATSSQMIGREIVVINADATDTLSVFPGAASDEIDALGDGNATTQTAGTTNRYICYAATQWIKL